jgi:hypothetical protein
MQDVIDANRDRINRIFTYYCSFGEPMNTDKLKSAKFIKVLKDAGLIDVFVAP